MPMGFIIIMVQGIKAIVTKNIIGTVPSNIRNTMVGITDRINTTVDIIDMVIIRIGTVASNIRNTMVGITERIISTVDIIDMVIIRIGTVDHTSILILVDINATLVIDKGAMGASKVSSNVVVA